MNGTLEHTEAKILFHEAQLQMLFLCRSRAKMGPRRIGVSPNCFAFSGQLERDVHVRHTKLMLLLDCDCFDADGYTNIQKANI
jgi:hypothetical protein